MTSLVYQKNPTIYSVSMDVAGPPSSIQELFLVGLSLQKISLYATSRDQHEITWTTPQNSCSSSTLVPSHCQLNEISMQAGLVSLILGIQAEAMLRITNTQVMSLTE